MSASANPPIQPTRERVEEIIGEIEGFSAAPRILAHVMALIRDERCDLRSIASLVRGDPALSADMLRIANSAWFSNSPAAECVEHALQKIGLDAAIRVLTLAVARTTVHTNLDNYCLSAEDFWAESLFHGLFMERLAQASGRAMTGEAYTAGLLRYIGRLAINHALQKLGTGLFWLGPEPLAVWEQKRVGFNYAEAGALLLRRWNFPENLLQAIAGQEEPDKLPKPNWLASALSFIAQAVPPDFDQPFNPLLASIPESAFLQQNGLTPNSILTLFTRSRTTYFKIRDSLA